MKKLIAILLLLALLLCGCGKQMEQIGDPSKAATHFSVVDDYARFQVIVDTDTGVMYAVSENGTMTVLLNWDGSPRCYPGFDAREDRTEVIP